MGKFQKGQSGNPGGRARVPAEVKAARELTAIEIAGVVEMVFHSSLAELQAIAADPNAEFVRSIVAKCCVVAHRTGDWSKVDSILNRAIGKVRDEVNLSGELTWEQLLAGSHDTSPKQD